MIWRNPLLTLWVALALFLATCLSTAEADVHLSFDPPTTRTDGSPLPATEIGSYELVVDGVLSPTSVSGEATSLVVVGLTTGDHCFVLRTVDSEGRVSRDSNEVCKPEDNGIIVIPPPVLPPAGQVPVDDWTVTGASSWEIENWFMPPECLFDRGSPCGQSPIWHSRYTPTEAQFPHWVDIDMDKVWNITGFRIQPRPGGGNGTPLYVEFYLSMNGIDWELAAKATLPPGDFPHEIPLMPLASSLFATADGSMRGHRLKFMCLSEQDGGNQCAVDELYVLGTSAVTPGPLIMLE